MNRQAARALHETTNLTFWMENPDWHSGNAAFDLACKGLQALPFSLHEAQKQAFFDTSKVLAVNGETVVAINDRDSGLVDKFMFRYPGKMALEAFQDQVKHEVKAVTDCLWGVALSTGVDVKTAEIFKHTRKPVQAVAQTQLRLNLDRHAVLDFPAVIEEPTSPKREKTARHMAILLAGIEGLVNEYGYYPDIAHSSGNLRRSTLTGSLTLIDVMPFYADGSRLIGDNPPNVIPHIQDNIQAYQAFVGEYGG